jgi:predicted nucleic acid-binding protein
VNIFVDTSVWSLALRRDETSDQLTVSRLRDALDGGDGVFTTGLVLQELLQGFRGPKARDDIVDHFASLPLLIPDRTDHIAAAELRNACRQNGIQVGTIDVLLAQLCVRHDLVMLSTDQDFTLMAPHVGLTNWEP